MVRFIFNVHPQKNFLRACYVFLSVYHLLLIHVSFTKMHMQKKILRVQKKTLSVQSTFFWEFIIDEHEKNIALHERNNFVVRSIFGTLVSDKHTNSKGCMYKNIYFLCMHIGKWFTHKIRKFLFLRVYLSKWRTCTKVFLWL